MSNGGKDKEKKRKPPTYTSMLNVAKTFKCDCFIPSVWQPFIGKHDLQTTKQNVTITELLSWEVIGSLHPEDLCRKKELLQTILSATKYTKWRMTIWECHIPWVLWMLWWLSECLDGPDECPIKGIHLKTISAYAHMYVTMRKKKEAMSERELEGVCGRVWREDGRRKWCN